MSRDVCYICGNKNRDVLEQHHIVPRRFGGGDEDENLVQLCSNCHTSVERLYDKRFYDELGVSKPEDGEQADGRHTCYNNDCTSRETTKLESELLEMWLCDHHKQCAFGGCSDTAENILVDIDDNPTIVCGSHATCQHRDCFNSEDTWSITSDSPFNILCYTHAEELGAWE